MNKEKFEKELRKLINEYSLEAGSDTPDFILASYLVDCFEAWNKAINLREGWYGRGGCMSVVKGELQIQATDEEIMKEIKNLIVHWNEWEYVDVGNGVIMRINLKEYPQFNNNSGLFIPGVRISIGGGGFTLVPNKDNRK